MKTYSPIILALYLLINTFQEVQHESISPWTPLTDFDYKPQIKGFQDLFDSIPAKHIKEESTSLHEKREKDLHNETFAYLALMMETLKKMAELKKSALDSINTLWKQHEKHAGWKEFEHYMIELDPARKTLLGKLKRFTKTRFSTSREYSYDLKIQQRRIEYFRKFSFSEENNKKAKKSKKHKKQKKHKDEDNDEDETEKQVEERIEEIKLDCGNALAGALVTTTREICRFIVLSVKAVELGKIKKEMDAKWEEYKRYRNNLEKRIRENYIEIGYKKDRDHARAFVKKVDKTKTQRELDAIEKEKEEARESRKEMGRKFRNGIKRIFKSKQSE